MRRPQEHYRFFFIKMFLPTAAFDFHSWLWGRRSRITHAHVTGKEIEVQRSEGGQGLAGTLSEIEPRRNWSPGQFSLLCCSSPQRQPCPCPEKGSHS